MRMHGEELELLVFSGHFAEDDEYVYAVCDQFPLTIPGRTEEEADAGMDTALEMYVSMLDARGELDAAIRKYGIEVIPITAPRFRPIRWGHQATPTGKTFQRLVPA